MVLLVPMVLKAPMVSGDSECPNFLKVLVISDGPEGLKC